MGVVYGANLEDAKWKVDYDKILMQMLKNTNSALYKEFCDWAEEDDDFDKIPLDEQFGVFLDYYEDNEGNFGTEALLCDYINEQEFPRGPIWFICGDGNIVVEKYIPDSREDILTKEDIRKILAKYLNPLLQEPVVIDWVYWYEY